MKLKKGKWHTITFRLKPDKDIYITQDKILKYIGDIAKAENIEGSTDDIRVEICE